MSVGVTWNVGQVTPATVPAVSSQYVVVPIQAALAGAPYNPSADVVKMAFKPVGQPPATGDFVDATWEATATNTTWEAVTLVGGAGAVLTVGTWAVWVQITDTPALIELPARGTLTVY